jgi:hypothetical protein
MTRVVARLLIERASRDGSYLYLTPGAEATVDDEVAEELIADGRAIAADGGTSGRMDAARGGYSARPGDGRDGARR